MLCTVYTLERKAQIASTMSCSYLWDIHVLCIHPVQLFVDQGDLYTPDCFSPSADNYTQTTIDQYFS